MPKKAFRESQLQYLTAGSAVDDGSHQIYRVQVIENGILKEAFFKRLAPQNHYPELLGKISVATSVFKRVFQGKKSADERLVTDDAGKIVGTLSMAIEGFRPLHFSSEAAPADPIAKERVIPSTRTLIEKNMMEILFGRWFLDDDDGHPHNIGFAGPEAADIDFDMFWYPFTIYMKEPRLGIGIPKKSVALSVLDWERFPNVKDSKPYHWPTYDHPGQETIPSVVPGQGQILNIALPKIYADPKQFQQLAGEQLAHEQKFAAALKALLTFDPQMVRNRLEEQFGDMPLNYSALEEISPELRATYEREFPELCNSETNERPFVDFMMKMYQKHYDNLYRVVVFYMGCLNNGSGLSLPSTCNALYNKPSYYREILQWAQTQNETTGRSDDASTQYNPAEIQKRYHQVWRDAYAPTLRELLQSTYGLTQQVLQQVSTTSPVLTSISGKAINDDSLTETMELFGTMPELSFETIEPLITVDPGSNLREGLKLLVEFTNQFNAAVRSYYSKSRSEMTEEDNLVFSQHLTDLHARYNLSIRKSLAHTTSHATAFNVIAAKLKQVADQVNFQLHLTTTDEQVAAAHSAIVVQEVLPHTNEEVIRQFNESLFRWVRGLTADEFNRLVVDIIDTKYTPTITALSTRQRAKPVKDYLFASLYDTNDNRLAHILSSGNEEGALNTLLIKHLTPQMLQTYTQPSLLNAVRDGRFERDIGVFTRSAVAFAKTDERLSHVYSTVGVESFYSAMYEWIGALSRHEFKGLLTSAIKEYEGGLWRLSSSRKKEVVEYSKNNTQMKTVALTFLNGTDSSTLNSILFDKIIKAIKSDIKVNSELLQRPGYKIISQFDPAIHKEIYFSRIKEFATVVSQRQEAGASSAQDAEASSSLVA